MINRNYLFTLAVFSFVLATVGFGCRNITGQVITSEPEKPGSNTDSFPAIVYHMPDDPSDHAYQGLTVNPIRQFYAGRQQRLFWTSNHYATIEADSIITFIRNIRYYGLLPESYHLGELESLKLELVSAQNIFRFEALLTDAYLSLVQHVWRGKTARITIHSDSVAMSLLQSASIEGGLIDKATLMENSLPDYRSLKRGLQLFIDSLSSDQKTAVLSGSPIDNDSISSRIRTIEVNLERWRLETTDFGSRHIFINIPAFTLYLVDNDSVVLESKIIVGTPETPTPVLSSKVQCFITYPYWHVPRKIAIEEYLPLIKKDISFIERNNFDVLDRKGIVVSADSVDWRKFNASYFPVRLRQREGTENALGVIKFVFDNPYAVFLHDTNAKRLFRSDARAFSHGCIRMEKALQLAHYLVTGDLKKKSKYLERFLAEETRHYVELQQPIPIHVRYFTCDFRGGNLNIYNDIYAKDGIVSDKLRTDKTIGDL